MYATKPSDTGANFKRDLDYLENRGYTIGEYDAVKKAT